MPDQSRQAITGEDANLVDIAIRAITELVLSHGRDRAAPATEDV